MIYRAIPALHHATIPLSVASTVRRLLAPAVPPDARRRVWRSVASGSGMRAHARVYEHLIISYLHCRKLRL
jgi:hypothetical protein